MEGKLRSVNTKFWLDSYIESLNTDEKLLFLYLLTNPLSNLLGAYEITKRRIAGDTGLNVLQVQKILPKFQNDGKIICQDDYIILVNFHKNQNLNSNMIKNVNSLFNDLPEKIKSCIANKCNVFRKVINDLEAFQSLSKDLPILRKEEEEEEEEEEVEVESEAKIEKKSENSIEVVSEDYSDLENYRDNLYKISEKGYKSKRLLDLKESDFLTDEQKENFKITMAFFDLFKKNLVEAGASTLKLENAKGTWIDEIRLAKNQDNYTRDHFIQVYRFLQKDQFWKTNILSTSKLRENMEKLLIKIHNEHGKNGNGNSKEGTSWNELAQIIYGKFN